MTTPTNITELAAYFPVAGKAQNHTQRLVAVPLQQGETYEQARAKQQEKTQRIQAKIQSAQNKE
jgi:hypothetical protein